MKYAAKRPGVAGKYKQVVCFPGGGVRGVVSLVLLDRLAKSGAVRLDEIYAYSGTSTGVILSACLAKPEPFSLGDALSMYKDLSKRVFERSRWIPAAASQLVWGASYDSKKLADAVRGVLGDVRLGDCPKRLVATVYSLDERMPGGGYAASPVFVHNFESHATDYMLSMKLSDVVIGAASAPTYFYPHRFHHAGLWRKYVDGGLVDNASCVGALSTITDHYNLGFCDDDKVAMLYVGNGSSYWRDEADEPASGWRAPRAAATLVNSLVQSGQTLSIKAMDHLLRDRFCHLDKALPRPVDLADFGAIGELEEFARGIDLGTAESWCRGYFV